MNTIRSIYTVSGFTVPLAASAWLLYLGEWVTVAYALATVLIGAHFLIICLIPTLIFALPAAWLMERRMFKISMFIGQFGNAIMLGVFSFWCLMIFRVMNADIGNEAHMAATVLAIYAAVTPIYYMASKEDNDFSIMSTAALFICSIVYAIGRIVWGWDMDEGVIAYGITAALVMSLQGWLAVKMFQAENGAKAESGHD